MVVVGAWVAIFVGLAGIIGVNGMGKTAEDSIPDSRASQALEVMAKEFPSKKTVEGEQTLQLVFNPETGSVTDKAVAKQIGEVLDEAGDLPGVESVTNPLDPQHPYISSDESLAVSTLTYIGLDDAEQEASYEAALELQESAPDELGVELGGNLVPLGAEQGIGEIIGVLAAFLVLLVTFGSLRAAGANLFVAAVGVGVGLLGTFAYGALTTHRRQHHHPRLHARPRRGHRLRAVRRVPVPARGT